MLKKGSKLYSILTGTCPKCHNESMYIDSNPLHLSKVLKMHDHCGQCGFKYQIEPSFFYGAMYVSYGLNVALSIAVFVIAFFFLHSNLKTTLIAILLSNIVLFPFVLRWSRNIYINMFVSFDKKYKK